MRRWRKWVFVRSPQELHQRVRGSVQRRHFLCEFSGCPYRQHHLLPVPVVLFRRRPLLAGRNVWLSRAQLCGNVAAGHWQSSLPAVDFNMCSLPLPVSPPADLLLRVHAALLHDGRVLGGQLHRGRADRRQDISERVCGLSEAVRVYKDAGSRRTRVRQQREAVHLCESPFHHCWLFFFYVCKSSQDRVNLRDLYYRNIKNRTCFVTRHQDNWHTLFDFVRLDCRVF